MPRLENPWAFLLHFLSVANVTVWNQFVRSRESHVTQTIPVFTCERRAIEAWKWFSEAMCIWIEGLLRLLISNLRPFSLPYCLQVYRAVALLFRPRFKGPLSAFPVHAPPACRREGKRPGAERAKRLFYGVKSLKWLIFPSRLGSRRNYATVMSPPKAKMKDDRRSGRSLERTPFKRSHLPN